MIKLILLNYVFLPLVLGVDWELVVDELNTATFGTGLWQFKNSCNGGIVTGNVGTCSSNNNNYL